MTRITFLILSIVLGYVFGTFVAEETVGNQMKKPLVEKNK